MKTLLFQGPPSSGKDTCVGILKNLYPLRVNHLEMKTQLFIDTCKTFNVELDWFMDGYDQNKGEPMVELENWTKRQALIHTSENIIKPAFGSDYYGKKAAERLTPHRINLFSDCGFPEEIVPITEASMCVLVHVVRPNTSFKNDSRRYVPVKERVGIYGNPGTPEQGPGLWQSAIDVYQNKDNWFDVPAMDTLESITLYNSGSLIQLEQNLRQIWEDFVV